MDSREQMDSPSHEEIAARAYEIFNREGAVHGRDSDHWFQAEQELRSQRKTPAANGAGTARSAQTGTGTNNRTNSGGLAQPVTGEAAMNASKSLSAENDKKGKGSAKVAKAARN